MMGRMTHPTRHRLTKRQEIGARSREEILDVALRLMSEQGYDGASIARIAAESGRPASSIYWHFGSKAGVLAAVMERGADQFFATLDAPDGLDDSEWDSREILRAGYQRARKHVEDNPDFLRLLFVLTFVAQPDECVTRVIERVTTHGRAGAHRMLEAAYARRGKTEATAIADRFALMAVIHFNGAFMSAPLYSDATMEHLMDVLVDTIADVIEH